MVSLFYNKHTLNSLFNPVKLLRNIQWRYGAKTSELPHVFVVGCPRSGTTLMYSILASHPNLMGMDVETFFFVPRDALNIQNYDRIVEACDISEKEIKDLFAQSQDLVDFYDKLANFFCQQKTSLRLLEKTPFHALNISYLIKHFPQAKFINMIRDGRDCYISHQRVKQRKYSLEQFASLWTDCVRSTRKVANTEKIMSVKYEDLVSLPENTTKKVMKFLAESFLEYQVENTSYSKSKIFSITDQKRQSSGHERLNQPISSQSVNQWKIKMMPEEIQVFNQIAGQDLQKCGYEV